MSFSNNPLRRTAFPFGGLRTPTIGSPFQVAETLMRDMDRFWSNDVSSAFSGNDVATTELYKTEDSWILKALLPGFAKSEVNVDVSKNHISIDASKNGVEPEEKDTSQLVRGGFPTQLSYREQVPATLDPATADAQLIDGVLTVTVKTLTKAPTGNKIVVK